MKTVFVSDITGKTYDTEEDCIKAEEEYNQRIEAEKKALVERKAKEEQLKVERKERANQVELGLKQYEDAVKDLSEKRKEAYRQYKNTCAELDKEEQSYRDNCTDVLNKFVKDYGQFNKSLKSVQQLPIMFRPFFNFFASFFDF